MEAFVLKESRNSPHINFDIASGEFMISGRSFPENARKFYGPIYEWLDANLISVQKKISVRIELYYVSSSSIISILELIKKLDLLQNEKLSFEINWCFDEDDEDIRKIGEDYAKLTKLPIKFMVIKE